MATNKSKVLKYFKVDNVEKTKLVCRVSVSSVALHGLKYSDHCSRLTVGKAEMLMFIRTNMAAF